MRTRSRATLRRSVTRRRAVTDGGSSRTLILYHSGADLSMLCANFFALCGHWRFARLPREQPPPRWDFCRATVWRYFALERGDPALDRGGDELITDGGEVLAVHIRATGGDILLVGNRGVVIALQGGVKL